LSQFGKAERKEIEQMNLYYLKLNYGDSVSFLPIMAESLEKAEETAKDYRHAPKWKVTAVTESHMLTYLTAY